jgi:NADP-dependent 3-hydroxy acid dehydrogenase YdfG
MSKVLREELKPHNVRVTSIMPGATMSNSWAAFDGPAERLMKAEDIAATVLAAYQLSKQSVVEEIVIRPQLGDL